MRLLAIPTVFACLSFTACDGHSLSGSAPRDGAADLGARVGPVDLAQAPATLAMTCDALPSALDLVMPCRVGFNLAGADQQTPGSHVTECRLAGSDQPVVWSFILPLGALGRNPDMVVHFPTDGAAPPPVTATVELGGERAHVSSVTGALSFSRVDPTGRAFAGAFDGKVVWKKASGAEITCDSKGPFWGGPGDFI